MKTWSPKAVIMKMAQRQLLNIVNIKSQKTLIWNLKEIQTFNILKKPKVRKTRPVSKAEYICYSQLAGIAIRGG